MLFRAKQKYGLEVLNYIVTSNHTHLASCLIYIDMNMVRTGVVSHPSEWRWSGYNEIQNPKKRYTIFNYSRLMELLGFESLDVLKEVHGQWIEDSLKKGKLAREERWSRSIAVGSREYIENIQTKLGVKVIHCKIHETQGSFELREDQIPYTVAFGTENEKLRRINTYELGSF
ncbi:hypothetical protein [uncultured Desulfobacter sp.]|uniref:hypothetical protein n=1 Tax=uncultured Desulfobacter sp. TaxID=240139 RepID=UPI002AA7A808|nr:hypothetical protein [uncultured Desulfobacter sp.]